LEKAFASPAAWIGTPPNGEASVISLSAKARDLVSGGHTVHPLGSVTAQQRAVPFNITISRFQQHLITPQTWSIASPGELTRDFFPPGELIDLTEDEKFSRPAFEKWISGVSLIAAAETHSKLRVWNTDYEDPLLIPDFTPVPGPALALFLSAHEALLAVDDLRLASALWRPPDLEVISIAAEQPVTVATTDTMKPPEGFVPAGSFTETLQAARVQFGTLGHAGTHQIVESWEVGL
jgi:hypothetical protein